MLIPLSIFFMLGLFIGIPVAFSLGISSLAALIEGGLPFHLIVQRMYNAINVFPLLAVPMFILAGELMKRSGLVLGLLKLADSIVGHITGGLGHVNVLASMFFGGMTGAAVADTSALGPLEIQMMTESGYDPEFSTALTVASSSIGPIIPPSIPMVLYGVTTGVSIGGLFLGGVIPGVLIGLGLMVGVYIISKIRNYPRREKMLPLVEFIRNLRAGLLAMGIPVIVVGGIIGGIVTPTEASALAVAYALVIGILVMRTLTWRDLYESVVETGITTAVVLMILGAAGAVSYVITAEQLAVKIGYLFVALQVSPYLFLLLINILMLLVGCFLDTGAAIIIFAPILAPIATNLGIHPIHFGVVVVMNLIIGLITPPVGAVLFVGCAVGKTNIETLSRSVMPFLIIEVAVLLLVTYVPALATFIPAMFSIN